MGFQILQNMIFLTKNGIINEAGICGKTNFETEPLPVCRYNNKSEAVISLLGNIFRIHGFRLEFMMPGRAKKD